jgi:hypothetical protein
VKVYLNRQIVQGPYGGGNLFVKAYYEFAEKTHGVKLQIDQTMRINPEVILLAGLANEGPRAISADQAIMWKMYNPGCKIVLRVNENDARKGTHGMDAMLLKVSEHIDGTVFVSKWLQDYFVTRGWACPNQTVIHNGVQRTVFKPGVKFNDGKSHIVAHHWSDNVMKGHATYERIDKFVGENPDKFAFTYIGRHQCDFKHTTVVRPLHGRALGEELGKHDIYISASVFEPGPNHVLEALACELPTYVHINGGGAAEFACVDHAFLGWEQLESILNSGVHIPNTAIALQSWPDCIKEYNDFLEQTWKANTP